MINFTRIICLCSLSAALAASGMQCPPDRSAAVMSNLVYKTTTRHNVFATERASRVESLSRKVRSLASKNGHRAPEVVYQPVATLSSLDKFSDMDVAGGGLWMYSIRYDVEQIVHNEYWTESRITGFEATVYDGTFKPVGTIKDKIRLNDDEVRPVMADLIPIATRHFFNDDDDVELMFSLGVNTTTPGTNHCRTYVYKLDNPVKDAAGNDEPVFTIDDVVSDVLDATPEGGEEKLFLTFANEEQPDIDFDSIEDPGNFDMWNEWSMKLFVNLNVYTKVGADGKLQKVMTKKLRMLEMPGDQENTPVFMSMVHNATPYFICPRYALPFYNDFNIGDSNTDQTMRDGNSLIVEIYRIDGNQPVLEQTTTIPAPKAEGALASYYSVGDLMYRDDVMMSEPGNAQLLVTRSDVESAAEESGKKTYSVYNADGTLKATLIENCLGGVPMSDIPGKEMQYMFVSIENSTSKYHFVNLESCTEVACIDYMLTLDGSDPDPMSANMERVPYGDSYIYVNEMAYPVEDEDLTYMRFTWLNDKGEYMGQQWLNMGSGVNYARSYLNQAALKKGFFAKADEMAYMVLIKRATSSTALAEELLIGHPVSDTNPLGKDLLLVGPGEKGQLVTISPVQFDGRNKLMVSYDNSADNGAYTVDFYNLPLDDTNAIEGVGADTDAGSGVVFDGSTIAFNGKFTVYDAQGRICLSAVGSTDASKLATGLYIVVTDGGASRKIMVK